MKKKITIIVTSLIIIFFLIYVFIKDERKLTYIESHIKNGLLFGYKVIDVPINFISEELKEMDNKRNIYNKYKNLKKKYENLQLIEQKYNETLKELNSLKENNNLKNSLVDYQTIDSYIINRNIGYWYDTLTIDKGKNDGILEDMAVINSKGLIGRITKVTDNYSTVKLLTGTNTNNRISVKIEVGDNYLYGLLSDYDNGYFIIEGISDNREIAEDSVVTTTGLDNIFPSGIKIGYVKKSVTDKSLLSRKVYIKSYVNFDNIDYVMVLKRSS